MQLKYFLAASVACVPLACGLASPAMAQETTSTIRGTVTGDAGPVGGASVEILDTATGAKTTVTTRADGAFDVSGLRPGDSYSISVDAGGFNSATVTDIVPVVTQAFEVPITLTRSGGADQAIVVTAARLPGAGNVSQGPATVLSAAQIQNVVSVNRDVRDLSRRDPFARLDDTPGGGRAISFAGQNARYNKFSVDGVAITDSFGLNPDGLPSRRSPVPFDAIGQFQAKVAPFDVREGNFQGGSVNLVLRSGSNKFQGTGFFAYSNQNLQGDDLGFGKLTIPNYTYKDFGGELSGPIIKDKLFFMVAAELIRAPKPLFEGPIDNNAGLGIPSLTQAQVDQISQISQSKYNYNTGGVLKTNGDKDTRVVAKIDWNISSRQRAAFTYTHARDQIYINSANTFTTPPPGLSLASNSYIQGNKLDTGVAQLNSDWTDNFSTEVRGFYKKYTRIQDPLLGRGFAEFDVCTAPTSDRVGNASSSASISCPAGFATVALGPDISRQTNQLNVKSYGGAIQARLKAGNHDIKEFFEFQDTKTFNAFLQRSSGQYYFDSLADFAAGTAQRFRYQNDVFTLNPNDAAATFEYQGYTLGIQDSWRVNDLLTINLGIRYDVYGGGSHAVLNQTFLNRYGFPNNKYLNGLDIVQPRFGFDFKPTHSLRFRGGGGIFGGGTPDVYVSNSFSNTGVLTNAIDIQQLNSNLYNNQCGAATGTPSACGQILSNVNGATIPGTANTVLQSAALSGNAPTNALSPKFSLPRQFRATISADWTPERLGFLGGGWTFGADFLYSRVIEQVDFTDLRVVANGLTTPDGRKRYFPITSFTDTNSDIVLTNSTQGRGYIEVVRLEKRFDFGLTSFFSYTHQNVKDKNPATSSVATSNYGAGVAFDPNSPAYGTANDQIDNAFKFGFDFSHAFFGDNKTTFGLFGESRTGHPYSFTFRDPGARSSVFGTVGTGTRYLMYVPTGINDPLVSYANTADAALIDQYITNTGLGRFRGQVAPRNAFRSPWVTKLDLHLAQELPTGIGNAKFEVFADIENFTNLLNKKWGHIEEYAFPYTIAPVTVQCLTAPQPNGQAVVNVGSTAAQNPNNLPAVLATNASQGCAQYRYASNNGTPFVAPSTTIYPQQSLYSIRIGARIRF